MGKGKNRIFAKISQFFTKKPENFGKNSQKTRFKHWFCQFLQILFQKKILKTQISFFFAFLQIPNFSKFFCEIPKFFTVFYIFQLNPQFSAIFKESYFSNFPVKTSQFKSEHDPVSSWKTLIFSMFSHEFPCFSLLFLHFRMFSAWIRPFCRALVAFETMGIVGTLSEATSASEDALRLLISVLSGRR